MYWDTFYLVQEKERQAPNAALYKTCLRSDPSEKKKKRSDPSFQDMLNDALDINPPGKSIRRWRVFWIHFQMALASEFCSRELKF